MQNRAAITDWSDRNADGNPRRAPIPRDRAPLGPLNMNAPPTPLYVERIPEVPDLSFDEARVRLENVGVFPAMAEMAVDIFLRADERKVRACVRRLALTETEYGDRYHDPAVQAAALSVVRDMRPGLWDLWNGNDASDRSAGDTDER